MKYEEVMSVQYGGNHYKDRKIQPWEVWEAYDMNGWEASAIKYLMRWKDKGKPLEDLYKALHNVRYCKKCRLYQNKRSTSLPLPLTMRFMRGIWAIPLMPDM